MNGRLKLPGAPSRRVVAVDVSITIDTAQLARDLLTALQAGPLQKWQLREQLHIEEGIIFRTLQTLKAAGQVKVVGKVQDKKAWALIDWQQPVPPQVSAAKQTFVTPKPKGPSTSWWANPRLTWDEFTRAREARDRELGRDGSGQVVRR